MEEGGGKKKKRERACHVFSMCSPYIPVGCSLLDPPEHGTINDSVFVSLRLIFNVSLKTLLRQNALSRHLRNQLQTEARQSPSAASPLRAGALGDVEAPSRGAAALMKH